MECFRRCTVRWRTFCRGPQRPNGDEDVEMQNREADEEHVAPVAAVGATVTPRVPSLVQRLLQNDIDEENRTPSTSRYFPFFNLNATLCFPYIVLNILKKLQGSPPCSCWLGGLAASK